MLTLEYMTLFVVKSIVIQINGLFYGSIKRSILQVLMRWQSHYQITHDVPYQCLFQSGFIQFDLSTARPKWRLDGPTLSDHLLYSLVNHAYANRYHHYLVR